MVALAMLAAGAATASEGFSAVPMTIVMLATFMFLVWLVAAGRRSQQAIAQQAQGYLDQFSGPVMSSAPTLTHPAAG